MAEDTSLREFVLGYIQEVGALVEPPGYAVYEVLLPEEIASRWKVSPYQLWTFDPESPSRSGHEEVSFLHYGHPLVEILVSELRQQSANTCLFINPLRLEKPGLPALAEKGYQFANARLYPLSISPGRNRGYHYVCFNFKASLVSDEKRELIVPVWMHLQGGYRVNGGAIQTATALDTIDAYPNLDAALPTWRAVRPVEPALAPETLEGLLDRARLGVLSEIATDLETLQHRMQRFLELDRARLEEYYGDLRQNIEKRLRKADEERRPALEAKLKAVDIERQSKLADVDEKYRLRVDLELINVAVIRQPKVEVEVEIKKRNVAIRRTAVWDPLLHTLEPFVCDVCGQPGSELFLCESKHLAHSGCLAPQCVDCKRTFCLLCAGQIHYCAVCDASICVHSRVQCKECGRETCQQHLGMCHAVDGKPQRLTPLKATPPPPPSQHPLKEERSAPQVEKPKPMKKPPTKGTSRPKPVKPPTRKAVIGQRIEVEVEFSQPALTAFVLYKDRQIAVRHWELGSEGIYAECICEKGPLCQANALVHRPANVDRIETQVMGLIRALAEEYQVPEKKISFGRIITGEFYPERHLNLGSRWKDPQVLAQAVEGFERLIRSR